MAKLESSLKNMIISLAAISLIAASVLGGVYEFTKQPILDSQTNKKTNAIKEVLPQNNPKILPEIEIELEDKPNKFIVFPAEKDGEFIGAAIQTSSMGYAGVIEVMVGFDKEGNIINYSILSMAETPGLGSKLTDWFKTDKNNQSIKGKNPSIDNFTVKKDGGDFDAITASTISSRAFLEVFGSNKNVKWWVKEGDYDVNELMFNYDDEFGHGCWAFYNKKTQTLSVFKWSQQWLSDGHFKEAFGIK